MYRLNPGELVERADNASLLIGIVIEKHKHDVYTVFWLDPEFPRKTSSLREVLKLVAGQAAPEELEAAKKIITTSTKLEHHTRYYDLAGLPYDYEE